MPLMSSYKTQQPSTMFSEAQMAIIGRTEEYVRTSLCGEGSGHDWWHIVRVRNLGRTLAQRESADPFIVELTCLLHDIGDHKATGGDTSVGPAMIREWLSSLGVEERVTNAVTEIVVAMAVVDAGIKASFQTVEGRVVNDADALDAMGAIGVARVFTFGGARGRLIYDPAVEPVRYASLDEYRNNKAPSVNHFYEKLLLLESLMQTDAGRSVARGRHEFMERFLAQFFSDWEGVQ